MKAKAASIAALLAILVFATWLRGHTLGGTIRDRFGAAPYPVVARAEPLDCDEAIYAYIGKRLVAGDVMYRDLTENKPPLGYWIYAIAVTIGGANETCIRLMPLPFVLATIALAWWIAGRVAGPIAAVSSALIYAVMSTDPYVYGNGANMEHFLNLFSTSALALLLLDGNRRRAVFAAGVCVGLASLVKQVGAVPIVVIAASLPWRHPVGPGRSRAVFGDLLAMMSGFVAPWLVSTIILIAQGAGPAAFADIVRYGGALAKDTPRDPLQYSFFVRMVAGNTDPVGILPWPFGITNGRAWWAAGAWPLWGVSIPALVAALLPGARSDGRSWLVGGWLVASWVAVALPGLFWQHYYMLALPGVAILVGRALGMSVKGAFAPNAGTISRLGSLVAALIIVGAIAQTIRIQVRDYLFVTPEQITTRYKGGGQWVVLREVGRELGRRTKGWDSPHLAVWGIQSPLNFYSGLDNVTPQVFTDPLVSAFPDGSHPQVGHRLDRTIRDYRARRPELIFVGERPFPALAEFLREDYTNSRLTLRGWTLPFTPDGRGLWVRRDRARSLSDGPLD